MVSAILQLVLWSICPTCTAYLVVRLLNSVVNCAGVSPSFRMHDPMSFSIDTFLLVLSGTVSVAMSSMNFSASYFRSGSDVLSPFRVRSPDDRASSNMSLPCLSHRRYILIPALASSNFIFSLIAYDYIISIHMLRSPAYLFLIVLPLMNIGGALPLPNSAVDRELSGPITVVGGVRQSFGFPYYTLNQ